MEKYLEVRHVTAGYGMKGKRPAVLKDISFALDRGKVLTIAGANGCGKSTLLKVISRGIPAWKGEVRLGNDWIVADEKERNLLGEKERAKALAVMLTERVYPERMTCYEVAAMGRYPYTGRLGLLGSGDKEVVEQVMERMKIIDYAGRYFHQISDGQRQRVLIARALCQKTGLLILDEPTAYLDLRHKYELLDLLGELAKKEKRTVVMTLHETELALKASDQILALKGGEVLAYETPDQIRSGGILDQVFDLDEETRRKWNTVY